jgi:hypothetical protein
MAQGYITGLGRAIEKLDTLSASGLIMEVPSDSDVVLLKDNSYLWRNGQEVRPIPRVSMDSLNKFMDYMNTQTYGVDRYVVAQDGGIVMVAPPLNTADSVVLSYYGRPATFAHDGTEVSFTDEWEQVLREVAYVIALQKISSPRLPLAIQERDKMIAAMFRSQTLRPQLAGAASGQ